MTSHDPDTLRRIMLLLKTKKHVGKKLSKSVARSKQGVVVAREGPRSWDDSGSPVWLPANVWGHVGDRSRRMSAHEILGLGGPSSEDESSIVRMLQLLDIGGEARNKLKATLPDRISRKMTPRQQKIRELVEKDIPF